MNREQYTEAAPTPEKIAEWIERVAVVRREMEAATDLMSKARDLGWDTGFTAMRLLDLEEAVNSARWKLSDAMHYLEVSERTRRNGV